MVYVFNEEGLLKRLQAFTKYANMQKALVSVMFQRKKEKPVMFR